MESTKYHPIRADVKDDGGQGGEMLSLVVKCMDDLPLTIEMSKNSTIQQLKNRILSEKNKDKFQIRLIYNGKMLREDGSTLEAARLLDKGVLICSITEPPPPLPETTLPGTYARLDGGAQRPAFPLPGSTAVPQVDLGGGTRPSDHVSIFINNPVLLQQIQQAQSEQAQQQQQSEMDIFPANGPTRESLDLLLGMSTGFFLGPIALIFLARSYISRNFKAGILMGVLITLLFSLARLNSSRRTP